MTTPRPPRFNLLLTAPESSEIEFICCVDNGFINDIIPEGTCCVSLYFYIFFDVSRAVGILCAREVVLLVIFCACCFLKIIAATVKTVEAGNGYAPEITGLTVDNGYGIDIVYVVLFIYVFIYIFNKKNIK